MKISVIVPVKKIDKNITEDLIPALKKQSFKDFELILIPDKLCSKGPAKKRDLGAKKAKGKILAFIDADAYPHKNWLKNALACFKNKKIAAVCGPGLIPKKDNLKQQVSSWVWQSWLGAGITSYRCSLGKKKEVDDYPSFNLLVRKKDFKAIKGFNSNFWPGEDTKLCHKLVYKLGKKIIYDPKIIVYHHRREIFIPLLQQVARFGFHRGHFARILPRTSRRFPYFLPSLFILGLILGPVLSLYSQTFAWLYFSCLGIYLTALLLTSVDVYIKTKKLKLVLLLIPSIFLTHFIYGVMFIKGLLTKDYIKGNCLKK